MLHESQLHSLLTTPELQSEVCQLNEGYIFMYLGMKTINPMCPLKLAGEILGSRSKQTSVSIAFSVVAMTICCPLLIFGQL